MRRIWLLFRYAWALPATAAGLLLSAVAMCAGATVRFVDGVMEVGGGQVDSMISFLPPSMRFVAITLGHVIIGVDHGVLGRVRSHEQVHVRQYERWGPLFFPLYLGSSLAQLIRGGDPHLHNHFERQAYALTKDAE